MPTIHPSAVIDGDVTMADDVVVGPNCVITGPVAIGAGTRLIGSVYLQGPLELGANNTLYPFACLGFAPQDLKLDPARPGAGTVVGDGNTFREGVTIHRATSDESPTRIGDENYWMAESHAGHDCVVGSNCVLANSTLLAGHVHVADRVITGGNSSVHQFCRLGRNVMMSGNAATSLDVCPFFMVTGISHVGSINLIGLRRSGMPTEAIDDVKWVYRTLYRKSLSMASALERLRERAAESEMVAEYVAFIESSKRGLAHGRMQASRSMA